MSQRSYARVVGTLTGRTSRSLSQRATRRIPTSLGTSSKQSEPLSTTFNRSARSLAVRSLSTSARWSIDILPSSDDPSKAKDPEPHAKPSEPTPLSEDEYTQHSDAFFQSLLNRLEAIQEEKGDWDVEYNVSEALHASRFS